jgi:hypothetical protein
LGFLFLFPLRNVLHLRIINLINAKHGI